VNIAFSDRLRIAVTSDAVGFVALESWKIAATTMTPTPRVTNPPTNSVTILLEQCVNGCPAQASDCARNVVSGATKLIDSGDHDHTNTEGDKPSNDLCHTRVPFCAVGFVPLNIFSSWNNVAMTTTPRPNGASGVNVIAMATPHPIVSHHPLSNTLSMPGIDPDAIAGDAVAGVVGVTLIVAIGLCLYFEYCFTTHGMSQLCPSVPPLHPDYEKGSTHRYGPVGHIVILL
jgi:hypothetical protein